MNQIESFFSKQPFTKVVHKHGEPLRLASDWFPISRREVIPELIKLGLEVEGLKVRKIQVLSEKWELNTNRHETTF